MSVTPPPQVPETRVRRRRSYRWVPFALLFVLSSCVLVYFAFSDGPFGRFQIRAMSAEQEAQVGKKLNSLILEEVETIADRPSSEAVDRIGAHLAEAVAMKDVRERVKLRPEKFAWTFRLVREHSPNAFCLPGGKVYVFSGLFPIAKTEGGLAAVMGHEIGHALAHHGSERLTQNFMTSMGVAFLSDRLGGSRRQETELALGAASEAGVLLPFSREHESEADHIGLILMAAAGYDPQEVLLLWERMRSWSKGAERSEYASTHPSHERRIKDLERRIPEVMALYEKSTKRNGEKLLAVP